MNHPCKHTMSQCKCRACQLRPIVDLADAIYQSGCTPTLSQKECSVCGKLLMLFEIGGHAMEMCISKNDWERLQFILSAKRAMKPFPLLKSADDTPYANAPLPIRSYLNSK